MARWNCSLGTEGLNTIWYGNDGQNLGSLGAVGLVMAKNRARRGFLKTLNLKRGFMLFHRILNPEAFISVN
ncbi:hypothetical protein L6452_40851 [Arctium lappa]|uniref:Uncharacterized protein n=1 Tax=Arctium lappa TaxID=4217 RepID=A0ACB8XS51_ARCLA|nr:hypothetical protein L6452_40851 [Arctium lappa]